MIDRTILNIIPDVCWEINNDKKKINGVTKSVKRISYECFFGPIPEKHFVLRSCKNSKCINPKHLFIEKNMNAQERFSSKINKNKNGCWEWIGQKDSHGYGKFINNGREEKASRVSYKFHSGTIPRGMNVCHTCDNPSCVNPKHLFLGTQKDNMIDACKKGRICSKLKEKDVREIRSKRGDYTRRQLAKKYKVSPDTIKSIMCNRTWKWVK